MVTVTDEAAPRFNPKFRKRKKYQGASWAPPTMAAEVGDGWYCRACRQRHGAMACILTTEKTSEGGWRLIWSCPKTGNAIHTMEPPSKGDKDGQ